jgi:hypothetical protein
LSGWKDRPNPFHAKAGDASAAVHRRDILDPDRLEHVVLNGRCQRAVRAAAAKTNFVSLLQVIYKTTAIAFWSNSGNGERPIRWGGQVSGTVSKGVRETLFIFKLTH